MAETMPGIAFLGDRVVEVREFPVPAPGPDEVVVRMRASGMCGSDLHFLRRPPGPGAGEIIQGHEPCGEIHALGADVPATWSVGQRVMIHHYWGCGSCEDCRSGWAQMCRVEPVQTLSGNVHGAHAPFVRVAARTLLPLPDAISFKAGAAIGCGTGTAWGGLARFGDVTGATLVVLGQGPVGLSATMLAASLGAEVIAVDIAPTRLDQAHRFGAAHVVDTSGTGLADSIRDLTGGKGVDLVLETSGVSSVASDAVGLVAPWGQVCYVGLGSEVTFTMFDVFRSQVTMMASWTLSTVQQSECADFVMKHDLPVDDLYSHAWSLEQAVEAYEWFDRQDAGKGVFEFD